MTQALDRTRVTISLEAACGFAACANLAARQHKELNTGAYAWPCSVQTLPKHMTEWLAANRTARKRSTRCARLGYEFGSIDRPARTDEIFEINSSSPERQGRPMHEAYMTKPTFAPLPDYECERHAIHTYGVVDRDHVLRAYTLVYRVGELVMFNTILGHAEFLRDDIMYLLVRGALDAQLAAGGGVAFYGKHDSGTIGLRFSKERLGFRSAQVEWRL